MASAVFFFVLPGCKGVRYGIWNVFRSGPDYETLDVARGEDDAVARTERAKAVPADYWTRYRGPAGNGTYDELPLVLDWPESGPPLAWRTLVGPAYSGIVVAGGLVITMEQNRDREGIVAFALDSGELVWKHTWPGRYHDVMSKEGPRSTPAVGGDSVVALGALGELRCVDLATGELRWRQDVSGEGEVKNLRFGMSASPHIRAGQVIVQSADRVSAFDIDTGRQRWRALGEKMSYATPVLGKVLNEETLVAVTAVRVVGLDPDSGAELWSFPWKVFDGLSCTQPLIVSPDRILLSAGYGKGSQLVRLRDGKDGIAHSIEWRSGLFKTRFNEPVYRNGYAFGLDDGTLLCLRVEDGRRAWKRGRYGYGQVLLVADRLLVLDEEGMVRTVAADPEKHRELSRFQALDGDVNLNVPALAHGFLLLRNERELVCYDLRRPRSEKVDRASDISQR